MFAAQKRHGLQNLEPLEKAWTPEPFKGSFVGKDIISVEQFTSRKEVEILFSLADRMREVVKDIQETRVPRRDLEGYRVVELFYQPSTRTYVSFWSAAQNLGATYQTMIPGMEAYSSAVKGESLPDTIRTIERVSGWVDLIILRHPEDSSSMEAANFARAPIINAGSGRIAHPTQAILDLYTIQNELGRIDDLVVTMMGDLRNGRTIKSLSKLLAIAGRRIKFNFISPEILRMPKEIVTCLKEKGTEVWESGNGDLMKVIGETDVLYVTRVQREWFVKQALEEIKMRLCKTIEGWDQGAIMATAEDYGEQLYRSAVEGYVVNSEKLQKAKKDMIVMHPLPRVGEIAAEIDNDPRAVYFRQMGNGLYTRMALLVAVLGKG